MTQSSPAKTKHCRRFRKSCKKWALSESIHQNRGWIEIYILWELERATKDSCLHHRRICNSLPEKGLEDGKVQRNAHFLDHTITTDRHYWHTHIQAFINLVQTTALDHVKRRTWNAAKRLHSPVQLEALEDEVWTVEEIGTGTPRKKSKQGKPRKSLRSKEG